jgi:hypothetical protein
MPKTKVKRERQLVLRVSEPLRLEIEAAAEHEARPLAGMIRKILVDWAARQMTRRAKAA